MTLTKEYVIQKGIIKRDSSDIQKIKVTVQREYNRTLTQKELKSLYRKLQKPFTSHRTAITEYVQRTGGSDADIKKKRQKASARAKEIDELLMMQDHVRKEVAKIEAIPLDIKEKELSKFAKAQKELDNFNYFMDHGVYPSKKNTDNDVIYVWKYDDMYKIGITSIRRGTGRIYDVAKSGNMKADILIYEKVEDAIRIEKELLKIGTPVKFDYKFDGSTEFRNLSDEEFEIVSSIIKSA